MYDIFVLSMVSHTMRENFFVFFSQEPTKVGIFVFGVSVSVNSVGIYAGTREEERYSATGERSVLSRVEVIVMAFTVILAGDSGSGAAGFNFQYTSSPRTTTARTTARNFIP